MINENNYQDRLYKYKLIFFSVFALIALFTTSEDLIYQYYFKVSSTMLMAGVFGIFLLIILFNRRIYLDLISSMLLFRLVIYIIPLSFTPIMDGYWGNYLAVIGSCIAYLISSQDHRYNSYNLMKKMNNVIMIFLILTSMQVIYMFFLLGSKYGTLNINLFKYHLVTPIGGSNYIASLILPLMIFVLYSDINKRFKSFSLLLALTSLLIIQSKNAIFVLIIFISYKFIKKYFKVIRNLKENRKIVIIFTVILIIGLVYIIYLTFNYFLIKWNMGMSYSGGSIYEAINALSSNRLNVYSREIFRWTDHFIIGNGLAYELGYSRAHNWLIELLVQSGLLGFIVYVSSLLIWYIKIHRQKYSAKFINATYYSIIIILIQGLAEVSIFTLTIDVLLWFLIGLSVSESNAIKHHKIEAQLVDK